MRYLFLGIIIGLLPFAVDKFVDWQFAEHGYTAADITGVNSIIAADAQEDWLTQLDNRRKHNANNHKR